MSVFLLYWNEVIQKLTWKVENTQNRGPHSGSLMYTTHKSEHTSHSTFFFFIFIRNASEELKISKSKELLHSCWSAGVQEKTMGRQQTAKRLTQRLLHLLWIQVKKTLHKSVLYFWFLKSKTYFALFSFFFFLHNSI